MSAPQTVYVSPHEAGQHLHVTSRTIRRWIAEGRLPARRFGPRTIRIRVEDLDALGHDVPAGGAAC